MTERIMAVAIKIGPTTYWNELPTSHQVLINALAWHEVEVEGALYGFLTSDNRFVDRFEAARIARRAGQLKSDVTPPYLRSEDIQVAGSEGV